MEPHIRYFVDPLEGFLRQLQELRGFCLSVPPLIEADRQRKWEEVGARPDPTGEVEHIDAYSQEMGPDQGWGFANHSRAVYSGTLVLAWELFRELLVRGALEYLEGALSQQGNIASDLKVEEERRLRRSYPHLVGRYRRWLGIDLDEGAFPGWNLLRQLHITRNSIVHHLGLYTRDYLQGPEPRFPPGDVFGLGVTAETPFEEAVSRLVDREQIPLDERYVLDTLGALERVGKDVWARLEQL